MPSEVVLTHIGLMKTTENCQDIIGVSLNEPHKDEFAVNFLFIYIYIYIYICLMSCRKSLPALILRVLLVSCVNSKQLEPYG